MSRGKLVSAQHSGQGYDLRAVTAGAQLVFVNIGKTLAQLLSGHFATVVADKDRELPPQSELPEGVTYSISPNIIRSGQTLTFDPHADNRVLTDAENAAIRNGAKALYYIGSITYADGAGNIKTTAFCRVLKLPDKPRSYLDVGRFYVHEDPDYEYQD